MTSANDRYPVNDTELDAAGLKLQQQQYQVVASGGGARNNIYYTVTGVAVTDVAFGKGYAPGTTAKNGSTFCLVNGKISATTCTGADSTRLLIGTLANTSWIATGHSSTSGWQQRTQ